MLCDSIAEYFKPTKDLLSKMFISQRGISIYNGDILNYLIDVSNSCPPHIVYRFMI